MEQLYLRIYMFVPTLIVLVLLCSIATQMEPLLKRKRTDDKIFLAMLCVLIANSLTDLTALLLFAAGVPFGREVAWVSTTMAMILNLIFIYLWTLFIDYRLYKSGRRTRRLRKLALIPLFFVIMLLVLNGFTESVFRITEDGSYEARPFWLLYVVVQFGYIVATSVLLQSYKKKYGGLHFFPVKSFIIPFAMGTLGEMVLPGMSLTTAGAAIGYLLFYLGMLRENAFEDGVTGFYNGFFLERISTEAAVGAFDFASGLLFVPSGYDEYMAKNGVVTVNVLLRREAATLRDELPEGCETLHLGGGRFLLLSQVAAEQEAALELLVEIVTTALTESSEGVLTYRGCYSFRREGQDPGSLLSELREKIGEDSCAGLSELREKAGETSGAGVSELQDKAGEAYE